MWDFPAFRTEIHCKLIRIVKIEHVEVGLTNFGGFLLLCCTRVYQLKFTTGSNGTEYAIQQKRARVCKMQVLDSGTGFEEAKIGRITRNLPRLTYLEGIYYSISTTTSKNLLSRVKIECVSWYIIHISLILLLRNRKIATPAGFTQEWRLWLVIVTQGAIWHRQWS